MSMGGNVGQALWTSRQDNGGSERNRNNRKTRSSNNSSNSSECRSNSSNNSNNSNSSTSSTSNNSGNNSSIPQSAYDLGRGKCIRFLEPGHRWRECTSFVPLVVGTNGQNNVSENVRCLASVLLDTSVGSCKEDPSKNAADKYH